jgi:hypothetical protein
MKKIFCIGFVFFAAAFIPAAALAGNNAQFISQNISQTMTAGQTYSVSVTMKNTGTAAWTETDKYRLGSQNPQDNWVWREGRVYLAAGESVSPGQTKTFTFSVKAPATPGAYNFRWQMVRDGVEWFGEKTSNVAVSVVRAVCVAGQVSGCKVCKADGSGWADNNSKCAAGQYCEAGVCKSSRGCVAKTCATLGNYECGSWSDGCGATISCGACAGGKTCNPRRDFAKDRRSQKTFNPADYPINRRTAKTAGGTAENQLISLDYETRF